MIKKVRWAQAAAEVLLLLVGASIALGLDAWHQERQDRRAEKIYLAALRDDFRQTHANFTTAIEGAERVRDWNLELLRRLQLPQGAVLPDSLRKPNFRSFWVYEFEPVLGTYHDMMQSGRLELLRNDSLRVALIQFESGYQRLERNYNMVFQELNAYVAAFMIYNLDLLDFIGGEYFDVPFPRPSRRRATGAYDSLEYSNVLALSATRRQDLVRDGRAQLKQVESVLRLIEQALVEE